MYDVKYNHGNNKKLAVTEKMLKLKLKKKKSFIVNIIHVFLRDDDEKVMFFIYVFPNLDLNKKQVLQKFIFL